MGEAYVGLFGLSSSTHALTLFIHNPCRRFADAGVLFEHIPLAQSFHRETQHYREQSRAMIHLS